MDKLLELVVYYQKKGLLETFRRIRARYFSVFTFIHYKRTLEDDDSRMIVNDDIRIVENDLDLLDKERLARDDFPREFYVDKTHYGKNFYLLYFQGELAGICWVFKAGEYSRFFKINRKTSIELNYIITLPEFRGNGLATRFTRYICENLKNKNYKDVYASTSQGNHLSGKVLINAGFEEFMSVRSYFSYVRKIIV